MDKFEMFERWLSYGGEWTEDDITPELIELYNENVQYLHERESDGFTQEEVVQIWVVDEIELDMEDIPLFLDWRHQNR